MSIKLGDICEFQSGGTPAKGNTEYYNGNIPWITTIALNGGWIDANDAVGWITEKAIKESAAKIVPAHSIMVGTRVGVGKVAVNAVSMATSQDIISLLKIDEARWSKDYLCKFLQSKNNFLKAQARGATIKGIKIDVLSKLRVPEISIEKQNYISKVIDMVKQVIIFRKNELQKLDELIRARFVELFGEPSTNPRGWDETTIGDECYYIKDGPHKSLTDIGKENGGHPFISVRNIVNGHIDFSTARYISDEDYADAIKKCHPEKGDMLYSKGGTTGIAKLIDIDEKFANWVHVAVLKFDKSRLNGVFFENMLNCFYCYEQSQRLTKGIANRDLVLSAMAQIKLYCPPMELQNEFEEFVKQVDKSKVKVQKALDETQKLFDSLMQQYFG